MKKINALFSLDLSNLLRANVIESFNHVFLTKLSTKFLIFFDYDNSSIWRSQFYLEEIENEVRIIQKVLTKYIE